MGTLNAFDPPAGVTDLAAPSDAGKLRADWSASVNRWTEQAILGDPWGIRYDSPRSFYYNPLNADLTGGTSVPIRWTAFPNRILAYFPAASLDEKMGYAEGVHVDGTFGPPPHVMGKPDWPNGPRGWQDEYCEWISTRDVGGKITRVDFTCENPEYWHALWRIDPRTVVGLYQQLVSPSVKIDDLYLTGSGGSVVIDPATAKPVYNGVNK